MSKTKKVRVRFAPSPTGYLHVGGARTALLNWLYAKSTGGDFILRVEDTDQARSTEEALKMQISDLRWLGFDWNEGPDAGGPHGPYKQSQRLDIYKKHADQLLESGRAYDCFCTDEILEQKKKDALAAGRPPHYDGTCRALDPAERLRRKAAGERAVVRFHVKAAEYVVRDLVRGEVKFPSDMVGDFVILRSDGMPVYNFCCVIDDALMEITHVLRAEEHLSNTLRQLMLYEAFGFEPPIFGHLSIILGPDKQKLSKRHGATSVHEYAERGYLPEALNNFLVLLGWSSPKGDEVMKLEELLAQFGLDRLNASPAVFDEKKLKWMNAVHLRALEPDELWKRIEPFLERAGLRFDDSKAWRHRSLEAFKTKMETLADAVELYRPLADNQFAVKPESVAVARENRRVVESWLKGLGSLSGEFIDEQEFEKLQSAVQQDCQVSGKNLFQPLRVAVVGVPHGVELKKLAPLLTVKSLKWRAEQTLKEL
jgi:nondiscriminating glutamyl-tRNA synthetase